MKPITSARVVFIRNLNGRKRNEGAVTWDPDSNTLTIDRASDSDNIARGLWQLRYLAESHQRMIEAIEIAEEQIQ